MLAIALKMLMGARAKFTGLIFGIAFTSFLTTFATSYFCGFMTNGFALISENKSADVWVMGPAVQSVEQTTNISDSALTQVRSVAGVRFAAPLALGTTEVRFANGQFQSFQIIGVDDATLTGAPMLKNNHALSLRYPDAVIVDPGGTVDKLETPLFKADQWTYGEPHLHAPTRPLTAGDELLINDHRAFVIGRSKELSRYPPRPLIYTTFSNAMGFLSPQRKNTTFILVTAAPSVDARDLAQRITAQTGLRARTSADFKADTVHWYLVNSEDVGDIGAMLILAMSVGFGVTGIMLYMFTAESLRQYAVLSAMGATPRLLIVMIFTQAGICALIGAGLGFGLCGLIGQLVIMADYPFRMMWFTPLIGGLMVILISIISALLSAWPVLKLQPMVVFSGR
jgi:putative ABC transport system permease protein